MTEPTLQILLLILCGVAGTAIAVLLGWTESQEAFNKKKAVASFLRGSVAIVTYITANYALATQITLWDYVAIALFAAGFDAVLKRAQTATQKT